ncbi:MAG TPA: efflux RND transporter permease subunit [Gemmataceae bacterium]|nr:efflux RND transporter permease subunit [Gemmataceae bacterium]
MISRFFIDRPIFATVISVVFVLAGGVAVFALPVAQYPEVTPPTVQVTALYPGASAQTVRDTVAAPIEEQVSGVEGMMYMSSLCTNDGAYKLTVTFKLGTDSDMAQVLVQNRVSLALPVIPPLVQTEGINVKKMLPNTLMIVNLISPNGSYNDIELSNYATIYVKDELGRLPGVAGITYLGQRDYSLRAWLNPEKLAAMNLSAMDVVTAIAQQNIQVAAGQIGQEPVPQGQQFQLTINTRGRLTTPEEFAAIILKASPAVSAAGGVSSSSDQGNSDSQGGSSSSSDMSSTSVPSNGIVRLRDVARVERGSQQYEQSCTLDGKPSVALSIYQLPGTNALETAAGVRAKMKELKARFPEGLDYKIVYDTTPFIRQSVHEVFSTLRDAVFLVAIVVLLFLQDWRAMILPMIDVPVSLIGTFAIMAAMGFTLNNLTLFGLVLAIGIVVDDAIVVLENIERLIATGLEPRAATIKAMEEITGPVLAITLVLTSVFLPCCFLGGVSGQFFRQFAVTIAVSTIISAVNALTMTPSRAVMIFKSDAEIKGHTHHREALPWWIFGVAGGIATSWLAPDLLHGGRFDLQALLGASDPEETPQWVTWTVGTIYFLPGALAGLLFGWLFIRPINAVLGWLFRGFNRLFDQLTSFYGATVGRVLRLSFVVLVVYGGLLAMTWWQFTRAPSGFIPQQDKGYLILNVSLPDSAAVGRTQRVMARIDDLVRDTPGVAHTVGVSGQSFILNANAPNLGSLYVMLEPFEKRHGPELSGDAIAATLQERCRREVRAANVSVFGAPPIDGLGNTGGFKLIVEDRGNLGSEQMQQAGAKIISRGADMPEVQGLFNSAGTDTPSLYLDIDRTKCMALGVQVSDVFNTLQVYFGSYYVNNFNEFGRTWQVNIQAAKDFRKDVFDIRQLQVRNHQGQMIRLGTLLDVRDISGPVVVMRYNMYSAIAITGDAAPGVSSGQAVARMRQVADEELPPAMVPEWTELAFLQLQAGDVAMYFFALAVVFVFLVLAAQYESWKLPLAVILVVPMCLFCSLLGVRIASMEVTLFTQIGFVVLVGLASKNAILIVEFAKQQQESGVPAWQATVEACRLRLRPIIMTSFAFILGVVPLVIAEGAGAEMRRSLGVAVFAGMLGVTLFGIFLTPVFYYVIQRLGGVQRAGSVSDGHSVADASGSSSYADDSAKRLEIALEALWQVPEDGEARHRVVGILKSALQKLQDNSITEKPVRDEPEA